MCPHEPEGEFGHINLFMTLDVTCVTGTEKINHVSVINVVSNRWIGIWAGMEWNGMIGKSKITKYAFLSCSSIALQELHIYIYIYIYIYVQMFYKQL